MLILHTPVNQSFLTSNISLCCEKSLSFRDGWVSLLLKKICEYFYVDAFRLSA